VTRPRQGRLVIAVNSAVGLALIVVIGSLAVSHRDVDAPRLSEFAPGGNRVLTDLESQAPAPQPSLVRPSPVQLTPPREARGLPRQLACYGWPDGSVTQTFDPQSPPCVSGWDIARGNGGATSRGVTGTSVRVGVPRGSLPSYRAYLGFFNTHFQLYGRTLQLVPLDPHDLSSDATQQAAAEHAAQQQVFATLVTPRTTAGPRAMPTQYLDVAARHQVITVLAGPSQASTTGLTARAPYAWSTAAGMDQLQQAAGSLACEQLAGRRATHARALADRSRRFGVVVPDAPHAGGGDVDVEPLLSALQACHSPATVERVDPTSPSALADAVVRLRLDGVTTVLPYLSAETVARQLMPAAEREGFRPEWVLTGTDPEPAESVWSTAPDAQLSALFGIAGWEPSPGRSPAEQASSGAAVDRQAYQALQLLAAGVQLAGPRLTPGAFGSGLADAAFPNPGSGSGPLFQATVGLDDSDHSRVNDVALAWWQGTSDRFCLVGGGRRWGFTGLPGNDPGLFDAAKGCGRW
jgi:hypothetical protein